MIAGRRWRPVRPAPPDLRGHLASCSDCRAAWDAAADDLRIVGRALIEAPSPTLERRLRIGLADRTAEHASALPVLRVQGLAWGTAIGAIAAFAAAHALPPAFAIGPAVLSLTGASLGFAGRAVFEALDL